MGAIAVRYPQVLGVGYEAVEDALFGRVGGSLMVELFVAKLAATVITLAPGFGGGVFSPSLMLRALAGGLAGLTLGGVDGAPLLVLTGMGALAACVLGAPLSTILMIGDLTGSLVAMAATGLSVAVATGVMRTLKRSSFFERQLAATRPAGQGESTRP